MNPLTRDRLAQAVRQHDQLLTIHDAADRTGVAPATVRTWVRRGHVPSLVMDGARLVLLSDVSTLEHATRTGPPRPGRGRRDMWARP